MSLATRCPACGTVFRVVQDQLKVSEGWVRCGRCSEVFNAVESLFDLEQEAPPPWQGGDVDPPTPRAEPPAPPPPVPAPTFQPSPPVPMPDDDRRPPAAEGPVPSEPPWSAPSAARADAPSPRGDDDEPPWTAEPDDEPPPPAPIRAAPPRVTRPAEPPVPSSPPAVPRAPTATAFERREPSLQDEPADMAPPPRFLAQAERARPAPSRAARVSLAVVAVALAVLAAGQAAYGARDLIAAQWPPARAALEPMCQWLGCRIEPLRRIQRLTVDGSGLAKLEAGSLYRLTLLLHNRDAVPLQLPSFDLTLTDAQGLVVARKVLDPAALGASQAAIPPGTELPLQAVLDPGNRRVVGYTVDIFYP